MLPRGVVEIVEQLGGPKTTGVGFGLGIERLILLMGVQQVAVTSNRPQVYVCRFGATAERQALQLAEQLRDRHPTLRLVLNAGGGSLKSQLKRADQSGAAWALVIGDDEAAAGNVQVKSLRGEGDAFLCPQPDLAAELGRRLAL